MRRYAFIFMSVVIAGLLSLQGCGRGGGGGSGSGAGDGNPLQGNPSIFIRGMAVLPEGTSATVSASLRAAGGASGMKIRLVGLAGLDVVSPVGLASDGSFLLMGVPTGSGYRIVVESPSGKSLLHANLPPVAVDRERLIVDPTSTALFILEKNGEGVRTPSEIEAGLALGKVDLTPVIDAVNGWLRGTRGDGSLDDVLVGVEGILGLSALRTIAEKGQLATGSALALIFPASGTTFSAGVGVPVTAQVISSQTVRRVQFFAGDQRLGEIGQPPYSFMWLGVPVGTFTLSARATLADRAEIISGGVPITVVAPPNLPPRQPSIISPTDGQAGLDANPTLTAGGFDDPNSGDLHLRTDWEIYSASGTALGDLVWTSAGNPVDTVSIKVTSSTGSFLNLLAGRSALPYPGHFFARVRFFDMSGAASPWSVPKSFSTRDFQFPPASWTRALGTPAFDGAANGCVISLPDGGAIIGGETSSDLSTSSYDVLVLKVDSTGQTEWAQLFGGWSGDHIAKLIPCSGGGFLFVGTTDSEDEYVSGNHGNGDIWLVKLDSGGNMEWQKCFGGSLADEGRFLWENPDGTFTVGGETYSWDGDVTVNTDYLWHAWVFRVDGGGNLLSQASFNSGIPTCVRDGVSCPDGSFFLAGYVSAISYNDSGFPVVLPGDAFISKVGAAGNMEWRKLFAGTGIDQFERIKAKADGGCVGAGFSSSSNGDFPDNHGSFDAVAVDLDPFGGVRWKRSLGSSGNDSCYDILALPDGGILAAGVGGALDGDLAGSSGSGSGWVFRLDSTGNPVSRKRYEGSGSTVCNSLVRLSDGGILIGMTTTSTDGAVSGNNGLSDIWLVKLMGGM